MNDITATIIPINPGPVFSGESIAIDEVFIEKMTDAMTPDFEVEFTPEEAEFAGAFSEDALSESDAGESASDRSHMSDAAAPAIA